MNGLKFAKPKRESTKKKPATVAEKLFMERVHDLGCTITGHKDPTYIDTEWRIITIHHDTRGGLYRNHYKIIPLENWLHLIQYGYKKSFHGDEKGWQKKHGSIDIHLIKTYELLLTDGGLPDPAMEIYTTLKEKEAQG